MKADYKKMPLIPKPLDKFWAVCNRYYADGETVRFSIMRGPSNPRLEGEGVITSARKNEYGAVGYHVKPRDKAILKRASKDEQKERVLHAGLDDLAGGPWFHHDPQGEQPGRQLRTGGEALPEKMFHMNVTVNNKGEQTLERTSSGFSEMELFGWLRTIAREMEVRLITEWASDPNSCSFCGNHANVSKKLIAGAHNTRICDSCIGTCNEILAEKPEAEK